MFICGNLPPFHAVCVFELFLCTYIILLPGPSLRGAKWMLKGAIKQSLRVQTPHLGGCWYNMGVSKNRGTPKWMVYTGKPY